MQSRTGGGMAVSTFPSQQVKTAIVTKNFTAETWQTVSKPSGARKILSLAILYPSTTNGYFLLWNERSSDILVLRLNTSGTNVVIVQEASANAQIEIKYI